MALRKITCTQAIAEALVEEMKRFTKGRFPSVMPLIPPVEGLSVFCHYEVDKYFNCYGYTIARRNR